jgi:hypothetical protein
MELVGTLNENWEKLCLRIMLNFVIDLKYYYLK